MKRLSCYKKLLYGILWLELWHKKNKNLTKSPKFPRFRNGIYFYWKSCNPEIINNDGIIQWEALSESKTKVRFNVELIVHESYFSDIRVLSKTIKLYFVVYRLSELNRMEKSISGISYAKILGANSSAENVRSNLTLPNQTDYGINIEWTSNTPCLSRNGKIYRGKEDEKAVLTGIFKSDKYRREKNYQITIKAKRKNGKKMLVMVPHGDDEIFLGYSVIRKALLEDYNVYICFFCNVDTRGVQYAKQRHKQSLNVGGYYGIPKDNIFILGYSTKWKSGHIYNDKYGGGVESALGGNYTYGTKYITDWHTLKYGMSSEYKRENVVADIKDVIMTIHPNVIFVNDFDRHLDHIAYSLFFEEAMGMVLKEAINYKPAVYKGFCYATSAYCRPSLFKAFSQNTPKPVKYKNDYYYVDSITPLENPIYLWKDRVRFKTQKEFLIKNTDKNPAAYAMKLYNRMYRNIPCFIHKDTVFWKRRTDSISYQADIYTTSGKAEYLNDFKLTDVKRLKQAPFDFTGGEWIPDKCDKDPKIILQWERAYEIRKLRFYRNPTENYIKKIQIEFNRTKKRYNLFHKTKQCYKDIVIDCKTSKLEIQIIECSNLGAGFTEIEVYKV